VLNGSKLKLEYFQGRPGGGLYGVYTLSAACLARALVAVPHEDTVHGLARARNTPITPQRPRIRLPSRGERLQRYHVPT